MKKIFIALMIALLCAIPVTAYAAEEALSEPLNVTEAETDTEVAESLTDEADAPSDVENDADDTSKLEEILGKLEEAVTENKENVADTLRDYLASFKWLVDLLLGLASIVIILIPALSKINQRLKKRGDALSVETKKAFEDAKKIIAEELTAVKAELAKSIAQNGKLAQMLSTLASGTSTVSSSAKAVLATLAAGEDAAADKVAEVAEEGVSFPALEAVAEKVAERTVMETDVLNG